MTIEETRGGAALSVSLFIPYRKELFFSVTRRDGYTML